MWKGERGKKAKRLNCEKANKQKGIAEDISKES